MKNHSRSLSSLTEEETTSAEMFSVPHHEKGDTSPPDAVDQPNGINGKSEETESIESLNLPNEVTNEVKLPGLQARHLKDTQDYEPLMLADLGPDSFDLVPSADHGSQGLPPSTIEQRSELIFSDYHLHVILQDYSTLQRFTEFITTYRPKSLPLLKYYLSSLKALATMELTNSIIHGLEPVSYHGVNLKFTEDFADGAESQSLHDKIARAFYILARDDLSAYVTHLWMNVVEVSMNQRVTGLLPSHLKE